MDIFSSPFDGSLKRGWKRRKYQRLDAGGYRKGNMKVIRIGGSPRRCWNVKAVRKLRVKMISPLKLWRKFRNAYINFMLNLGGQLQLNNTASIFGGKRIPKIRQASTNYSHDEFHNRLVYEIYKNLSASRELATDQSF